MKGYPLSFIREGLAYSDRKKKLTKQVKKHNLVIFGGQAIKKQIGMFARPSFDYDLLSPTPHKHAHELKRTLNKDAGGKFWFVKSGVHQGTFKLFHKGFDMKKNTDDDIHFSDYTKNEKKRTTTKIGGIRYADLNDIISDKKRALSEPIFKFRHNKDFEDLQRIKASGKLNKRCRQDG